MATKIEAANILMKAGIPMVICDGRRPQVVADAVAGRRVGTVFSGGDVTLGARKLWIALGSKAAGEVVLDDGARDAVVGRNTSLLPAGVVAVRGSFGPGDAVVLVDRSGGIIARGLTEFSSADLDRVKGLKSGQIAQMLPHVAGKAVVHKDHLVIL
jgi:glutamate 5-kinase